MGVVRRGVAALAVLAALVAAAACSDDDGGGGGGGSAAALCALVGGTGGGQEQLFAEGFDPSDRAQATTQLQSALVELGELRAAAPSSLRGAVDDEVSYLEALLEAVETTDPDDPAAVVDAVNGLDEEREAAEGAARELAAFQAEHCRGVGTEPTAP